MASQKYTLEQVTALMESDEPLFIIRAKDKLAPYAVAVYINRLFQHLYENSKELENMSDAEFTKLVDELIQTQRQINQWQAANPNLVKYPHP